MKVICENIMRCKQVLCLHQTSHTYENEHEGDCCDDECGKNSDDLRKSYCISLKLYVQNAEDDELIKLCLLSKDAPLIKMARKEILRRDK